MIRGQDREVIMKVEKDFEDGKEVEVSKDSSTRHQPSHFTTKAEATYTIPLR